MTLGRETEQERQSALHFARVAPFLRSSRPQFIANIQGRDKANCGQA
jgi:hypothetical protein